MNEDRGPDSAGRSADDQEYEALWESAMRDTLAIGALPKELEGTTGSAKDIARRQCTASAVFLDGEWKGHRLKALITAGHVVREFRETEGRGVLALGRTRDESDDRRALAVVEALDTSLRLGENVQIRGHREVRLNDVGLLWLSGSGAERLRSTLACTGYNPGLTRRPYEGKGLVKALCAAANNEWRRRRSPEGLPAEAAFAVYGIEQGDLTGQTVETRERAKRRISMAQIEEGYEDMCGTSGAGIWRQCHRHDGGGRELVGITGSYLRGWPERGEDRLLIVEIEEALNELVGQA